jgi:hypothetical protein
MGHCLETVNLHYLIYFVLLLPTDLTVNLR